MTLPSTFLRGMYGLALLSLIFFNNNAQANLSLELRSFHEAYLASGEATIAGQKLRNPKLSAAYYSNNQHIPIWITGAKKSKKIQALVNELEASQNHGFDPQNYHLDILSSSAESSLALEILATDAFISQVRDRTLGVISPQQVDKNWFLPAKEVDSLNVLQKAIQNNEIAGELQKLWPTQTEYWLLIEKRKSLIQLDNSLRTTVPTGLALKKGSEGDRVSKLKERLMGPADNMQVFDDDLEQIVKVFQLSNGLEPDGIVGNATLGVINTSNASLIDKIDANLERWRWLPKNTPTSYIRVNIAAFQLRAFKDNAEQLKMNVIVGKPYRKTPPFTENMKYLVVNPYWNVPFKIATQDKLPLLISSPETLDILGFEAKQATSDDFLPVSLFDWTQVSARNFNYSLRQKPGPKNALGTIKFMLPNQHSVYLHDTPDHSLFSKQERSFSSGCIRLSEPALLAEWILKNDNQPQLIDRLNTAFQSNLTETIYLKTPLPVLIVYFTAFKNDDGQIVFRRDIYDRDGPIITALKEN